MFLTNLKNIIKRSDLFYSSEMLRYENELEYKSLTGGILSLALIVTVIVGFANMIILTMQRENISSVKEVVKQSDPPFMSVEVSPENKFMMGIQVYGVNLSAPSRFFDYIFQQLESVDGYIVNRKIVPLVQCTRQHWSQLPQVVANFQHLRISNWLCPEIGFNLKLKGKYSSPSSIEYIFTIKKCINSTSITCASPQQVSQLFLENGNQFYLTYYYINSIINEFSKDYIQYYLEDSYYTSFSDKIGAESYIYFMDYTVSTDDSIWPFQSIQQVKGCFVQGPLINRPTQVKYQGAHNGQYAYIRIDKSTSSVKYNRAVQKISTVLSFMGGMISAVSAFLYIIKAYNRQAFQIEIASALFIDPPQSEQLKSNNFISFLKFNIYKLLKFINCGPNSQGFTITQRCLQEMDKQLDVKSLIQRIVFLEQCITFLFEDYQLSSIQMKRPTSYTAIKRVRQRCFEAQQVVQEDSTSNNLVKVKPERFSFQAANLEVKMMTQESITAKLKLNPNIKSIVDPVIIDEISQTISDHEFKRKETGLKQKTSILTTLQNHARKGDRVSSKIYKHLYEKAPRSIFKQYVQLQ